MAHVLPQLVQPDRAPNVARFFRNPRRIPESPPRREFDFVRIVPMFQPLPGLDHLQVYRAELMNSQPGPADFPQYDRVIAFDGATLNVLVRSGAPDRGTRLPSGVPAWWPKNWKKSRVPGV
jgi:hypothetical protein